MTGGDELLVSVVITTYNRADSLRVTLDALGRQTLSPARYEVLVTDDGSTDGTPDVLASTTLPCALRTFRHDANKGISAGRNLAIGHARGTYLVLVSDDVVVPEDFLVRHVETLERFPRSWVVGGFRQLDSLLAKPFGRYIDNLERAFDAGRRSHPVERHVWEMSIPTARNLSLPRRDMDGIGMFDEQFRHSCEDQDLAHRAREAGIRFLYNDAIDCLHNDHIDDLVRFCRQQRGFVCDGVLFCAKRPEIHGDFVVLRANRRIDRNDPISLRAKKAVKALLARDPLLERLPAVARAAERLPVSDPILFRLYQAISSVYILRGVREGLDLVRQQKGEEAADRLGRPARV